jgi:putative RecB family exonuclease
MFSHSRIAAFEHCPLKFRFRYIDHIETEGVETVEAFMGHLVHGALEKLYKDLQFAHPMALEELIDFFRKSWEEQWTDEIIVVKEEYSPENYRKMGEKFLTDYYKRHRPFDRGKTIGLEMRVILLLPNKERLQGYIDRLDEVAPGHYEIHDYKTNSHLKSQAELDKDRQLALYAIAVRQQFPDAKKVDLVWHFLAFDKEMRSSRTEKELDALARKTAETIEKIEKTKVFPAKESALCPYCEYQEICPKRAHLFKTRALPENEYLKEPGVVLVEALWRLKEEAKLLDSEAEKIKEALLKFAEENKIDNVAGKDHLARVRIDEIVNFPAKGERADLIKILKKIGVWEEVSDLDQFALRRKIAAGEVDNSKIEKFETRETRKTVSISKMKK